LIVQVSFIICLASTGLACPAIAIEKSKLQPGDLVFFAINSPETISHVGFYTGNIQFISATTSKGVTTYSLDNTY